MIEPTIVEGDPATVAGSIIVHEGTAYLRDDLSHGPMTALFSAQIDSLMSDATIPPVTTIDISYKDCYVDSEGLRQLLATAQRRSERGEDTINLKVNDRTRRLLNTTGTVELFNVLPEEGEA